MYFLKFPESKASTRAVESTISSLAKLSRQTSFFIELNIDASIRLRVESKTGMCKEMKSELPINVFKFSMRLTSLGNLHAASTDNAGSKPCTLMPSFIAISATIEPMAPSPTTPRVLPAISFPLNRFSSASMSLDSSL